MRYNQGRNLMSYFMEVYSVKHLPLQLQGHSEHNQGSLMSLFALQPSMVRGSHRKHIYSHMKIHLNGVQIHSLFSM
jgi:hypothetical protein